MKQILVKNISNFYSIKIDSYKKYKQKTIHLAETTYK